MALAASEVQFPQGMFGDRLDATNPLHQAAYLIGDDLYRSKAILRFDPTIIIMIIEILQSILPILTEYCPSDPEAVASNARQLGWFRTRYWNWILRGRVVSRFGWDAWAEVGGPRLTDTAIKLAGENPGNLLGDLLPSGCC